MFFFIEMVITFTRHSTNSLTLLFVVGLSKESAVVRVVYRSKPKLRHLLVLLCDIEFAYINSS